jgi:hypothetical protein
LGKLAVAAMKEDPKNEDLGVEAFRLCVTHSDWASAQQVMLPTLRLPLIGDV